MEFGKYLNLSLFSVYHYYNSVKNATFLLRCSLKLISRIGFYYLMEDYILQSTDSDEAPVVPPKTARTYESSSGK